MPTAGTGWKPVVRDDPARIKGFQPVPAMPAREVIVAIQSWIWLSSKFFRPGWVMAGGQLLDDFPRGVRIMKMRLGVGINEVGPLAVVIRQRLIKQDHRRRVVL